MRGIKTIEDPLVKIDIYIGGMQPIKACPIEVIGRRSYELILENEDEKNSKRRKYQFVIIVDVNQDGITKVVSFESQVIMTNNTMYNIEIAHTFLTSNNEGLIEMTKDEIIQSREDYKELEGVDVQFENLVDIDKLEIFD
jgi:hypothetical protein